MLAAAAVLPQGPGPTKPTVDTMHRCDETSISAHTVLVKGRWVPDKEVAMELDVSFSWRIPALPKLWDTTDAGSKHPRELFRSGVGRSQPYGHVSRVLRERPPHWLKTEDSRRGWCGFVRPPPVARAGFALAASPWCLCRAGT